MNVAVAAVLFAAGCGRLSFDERSDAQVVDAFVPSFDARVCEASSSFDEDGDGVNDTCDGCPGTFTTTQDDSDGDGVGDACDPEISNPRQRILWFDGFNSELPEWNTNDPIVAGQRIIDVAAGDSNAILMIPGDHFTLELAGQITAVGAAPNQILLSAQPLADDSYYVELIDSGSGRRRSLMHALGTSYTELDGVTDSGLAIPTGALRMSLDIAPDRMQAQVAIEPDTASMTSTTTPPISSMYSIVYVRGLSVALDYAIWIETL